MDNNTGSLDMKIIDINFYFIHKRQYLIGVVSHMAACIVVCLLFAQRISSFDRHP